MSAARRGVYRYEEQKHIFNPRSIAIYGMSPTAGSPGQRALGQLKNYRGTILLVNPLTAVPVYYLAYRVGAALLRINPQNVVLHHSWDWIHNGIGPVWKPFLLGCLACAALTGLLGWLGLELLWRWRVTNRYRTRHPISA